MDPVRVGWFQVENDASECFSRKCGKAPGAEVEIVELVFQIMQQTYNAINVTKEYGVAYDFGSKLPNGSWTGVMGLLVEDKIDMCGLSMRITLDRSEDVLFSYPTRFFQTVFIVHKPCDIAEKNFIFNAFSYVTWTILFITLITVFCVNSIFNLIQVRILKRETSTAQQKSWTTLHFETICPSPHRAFLNAILLFCLFIILQMYQTKMYANLASPMTPHIPFYTLDQALDVVARGESFFTGFDSQTMLCSSQKSREKFSRITAMFPPKRRKSQREIEEDMRQGGIYQSTIDGAFLPSVISWLTNERKNIAIRDDMAQTYFVGFSFSKKNKKLRDRFNDALFKMLPAVSHITAGHGYRNKKSTYENRQARLVSLALGTHMWQLFKYFLAGLGACTVAFIVEVLVFYGRKLIHIKNR